MQPQYLYSPTQIAKMRLPGLPDSVNQLIERAVEEAWYFEERRGLGGRYRRVYQIPDRYLNRQIERAMPHHDILGNADVAMKREPEEMAEPVVKIVEEANIELIELAVRSLEEWLQGRGLQLLPRRKSAVVALLYDYLYAKQTTDREDIQRFLRAVAL